MFGVDVANITRMLIVYTQGVVGFGIADQAGLPWKYFEDFSNRVIKEVLVDLKIAEIQTYKS